MSVSIGVHAAWFADVDSVPGSQSSHARSLVALPSALTNEPGGHDVQGVHEGALESMLKCPLGQAEHTREPIVGLSSAT